MPRLHARTVGSVLLVLAPLTAQEPRPAVDAFESYVAHLAAAEGAAARQSAGAMHRWLQAVPAADRQFEWRVLHAEADHSDAVHTMPGGGVSALATSPDGDLLAIGAHDGTVTLCQAGSLQPVRTITAHNFTVLALAFDATGARLASSSQDRGAKAWNVASGELLSSFAGHTYPVTSIRWAPDGERLCSTSYQRPKGGEVRIWKASDATELQVLQSGYAPITCVDWHPSGERLVAASWDQHLHVFDLGNAGAAQTFRLGAKPEYRAAQAQALSPDGRLLAVACKDDQVHLFDAWKGEAVRDLVGHRKSVEGVVFSPDGRLLATTSADQTVRLWDPSSGDAVATLRGHRSLVRAVVFARDGASLFTGSADGTVRRWSIAKAVADSQRLRLPSTAYALAERPDGTALACGFADGTLHLRSVRDGTVLLELPKQAGWIGSLQWTDDGSELLAAGETGVQIWRIADRSLVRSLVQKDSDAAARSPDRQRLVVVSRDAKVRCFVPDVAEPLWEHAAKAAQKRIAFAPDGRLVAVVGQAGAFLHDASTGTVVKQLVGHRLRVQAVAFAPGGRELLTLGDDGCVCAWNPTDGALLARIDAAHDAGGTALAFAPDGRRFATIGEDDRLVVWDSATRQAVWSRDQKDGYALDWSRDGTRLWFLPLAAQLQCFDSVPRSARP
jgi:WD40 repeat protein